MNKIILTVDTEGHVGKDPIKHLMLGKTDQGYMGIPRIMDICDQYDIKAIFFVDFAEAWDYGKDKIKDVVNLIKSRGYDVGVHIHPDHIADKDRLFLWQYTYQEQFTIIQKCTDLYIELLHEEPVAFRAGKYSANYDTLSILSDMGYKYDFSEFYGQKWCGIYPPVTSIEPGKYMNIVELPVTVFKSLQLFSYVRFDKIDAVMDFNEFRNVIGKYAKNDDKCIGTLFFHSFSMLDWRDNPDTPVYNINQENKFRRIIKETKKMGIDFIGVAQLNDYINLAENSNNIDIVSNGNTAQQIYYSLKRVYSIKKMNKKAKLLWNGFVAAAICIPLFIIALTNLLDSSE